VKSCYKNNEKYQVNYIPFDINVNSTNMFF